MDGINESMQGGTLLNSIKAGIASGTAKSCCLGNFQVTIRPKHVYCLIIQG